jgi:precorrin-6A/cobalt-precorrin-6A reductase
LITKDSGDVGGTIEKIDAAKESNIKTLVITRPSIEYPQKFDSIDNIIKHLEGGIL